jgi:hypothetical protein
VSPAQKSQRRLRHNHAANSSTKLRLSDGREFARLSVLKALRYTQHAPGHSASGNQRIVDECDGLGLNQSIEMRFLNDLAQE